MFLLSFTCETQFSKICKPNYLTWSYYLKSCVFASGTFLKSGYVNIMLNFNDAGVPSR